MWNENLFFDGGERHTVGGGFEKCGRVGVGSGLSLALNRQQGGRVPARRQPNQPACQSAGKNQSAANLSAGSGCFPRCRLHFYGFWQAVPSPPNSAVSIQHRGYCSRAKRRTILSQERSVNSDICLRRGILLFISKEEIHDATGFIAGVVHG